MGDQCRVRLHTLHTDSITGTSPARRQRSRVPHPIQDLPRCAVDRGWIGNGPMSGHGLPGPHRADFLRRVITDRKDEIKLGRTRLREFIPALAAQVPCWNVSGLELTQRLWPYASRRMTPRTKGGEGRPAFVIKDRLRHDGARGISRAQKQDVVTPRHYSIY